MDVDVESALSGRAGLAGVQWLLLEAPARAALRGALLDVLDTSATLGAISLQRAKYKPGRHLTAYYTVELRSVNGDSTRLIEVSWRMPGNTDLLDAQLAAQAAAVERGLAAPFRALLITAPDWGMRAQIFPLDANFPRLARLADPCYVRDRLATEATIHEKAAGYHITPIRYRPGQRHVLRYEPLDPENRVDERGTLFAKIYNNDKGARTFQVAARIADWLAEQDRGITAVRPQAFLSSEGLVLYPRVTGTPLSDLLRDQTPETAGYLRAAGAALQALHQTPTTLIELQPHSFAKEIKGVTSASEHVHALLPAAGAQIQAILATAQALYERLPQEPPAFAYGDFKADHLWVTPGGLTLIDFDTCYLFDPAIDLGKFLADLHWWYDRYQLPGVEQAREHFLAGYGAAALVERIARARLFEVVVLVKSTVRRVRLFDVHWGQSTTRLIETAADLLRKLQADT